jgi:mannose-6-phosphate isomerase
MAIIFPLKNKVKHYDWGSPRWIPQLLGLPNPSEEPWAELWMGVHPGGPSETEEGGETRLLSDVIARDPRGVLGEKTAGEFGGLPFLFKLLAAEKPLSIQAHPDIAQARAGWEAENRRGIPPEAPHRNYRDRNHKPEILCALSPFRALCGFREPADILARLDCFIREAPEGPRKALDPLGRLLEASLGDRENGAAPALSGFLRGLFNLSAEERLDLSRYAALRGTELGDKYPAFRDEWETAAYFAGLYPGDPAVISPLYLNLLRLRSGEALYLPAGVLHGYIEGFGVELMANSDNVLRGGLTAKHVDVEELLRVLRFSPHKPRILNPGPSDKLYTYPAECREFSLTMIRGGTGEFPCPVPGIVVVTQGEVLLSAGDGGETTRLRQGESAFIADREGPGELTLSGTGSGTPSGTFTLYAASVGAAPDRAGDPR